MNELPGVLWAYRTTSRRPTGVSPFALTYGMEAIILIEIGMPTLRIEVLGMANAKAISKGLDMADELREAIAIRIASYQKRMENLYNMHIKSLAFRAGDLVLRRVFENTIDPVIGKFQPNWKGSYVIVRVGPVGLYGLNKLDGAPEPRMWILCTLKGIVSRVFFKGLSIKFPIKYFIFNLWNITNQVFFKGIISFNFWNNLNFKRLDLWL